MTFQLAEILEPELRGQEGLWSLFADVEMPLVPILADMELTGVAVDCDWLGRLAERLRERIAAAEQEIIQAGGRTWQESPVPSGRQELHDRNAGC
jgi:DNA polymerase-1